MQHRAWWPSASASIQAAHCANEANSGGLSWQGSDLVADVQSLRPTPPGGCPSIFNPPPQQQQVPHIPTIAVAAVLTDASRELLLQLVPPIHAYASAHLVVAAAELPLDHVLTLPLGAQVTINVTGLAADADVQAASCELPGWCPSCTSTAVPCLLISSTHNTPPTQHAVHLLAEGIAGGSLHYFPLGEPLPLLGTLAALPTHHTAATVTSTPLEQRVGDAVYSVEQLAALLLQTPTHIASTEPISPVQPAQAASQAPTQMQAPTTVSPQDRQHVQQPLPHTGGGSAPASVHIDRATAAAELAMLAGSTGASTQQSMDGGLEGSTGAKAGTGPVTDFDRWMRQDERLAGIDPSSNTQQGTAADVSASEAVTESSGATRVQRYSDVSVGDLIVLAPLIYEDDALASDGGDVNSSTGGASQHTPVTTQGVVAEVLVDDPIQPQGVLVRTEDDVIGHTVRVITKGLKQQQEAWPALAPTQTTNSNTAGAALGKAAGKGLPLPSPPRRAASPAPCQPAGGIRIIRAGAAGGVRKGRGSEGGNGVGTSSTGSVSAAETAREWERLQARFGSAICGAVLEDCGQNKEQAVQVLLDQEKLPDLLGDIVSRSVARVEEAAAEAQAAEEALLQEQRQQASQRMARKWAPRSESQPDLSYTSATHKRTPPAPQPGSFPTLPGARGRGQGGSGRHSLTSAGNTRWNGSVPANVTLLRKPGSLSALAGQAGVNVKDAEALQQLYPGLNGKQTVTLLQLSGGNVSAMVEELRALGLEPGTSATDTQAYDTVLELFGLAGVADAPEPSPAAASTASGAVPAAAAGGSSGNADWDKSVAELTTQFDGLAADVAAYALRAANGDVARAAGELQRSVRATNIAEDDARSRQLAAQLAADDVTAAGPGGVSFAMVTGHPTQGTHTPQATSDTSTGPSTPTSTKGGASAGGVSGQGSGKRVGGGGGGTRDESWSTVAPKSVGKPRTAADIQKAKLRVSAGKARNIAQIYYDARNVFYTHAAAAFAAGDGKAAAELSKKGREYGELAKQYRAAANDCAWREHNWGAQNTFTMDLHGMHVDEAIGVLERQIDALKRLVLPDGVLLKVITGKGNHSLRNVAAIKPAVIEYLQTHGHKHFLEPGNEGVVVVHVQTGLQR